MADTKISAMPTATSLVGTELIPIVQGGVNKSTAANLFIISAGISGGQTVIGGTAASENLTLSSTSHATKGAVKHDSYFLGDYTALAQSDYKLFQMNTFNNGTTYQGGGWIVLNAAGSGYTNGSYNTVTFTYTSGTVATNLVLTGIIIAGGIATGTPLFYWISGGVGADGTTRWTASGIPGGSGFTVKTGTDFRSVQGNFIRGITQGYTNPDLQVDNVEYEGYNYTGQGKVNASEASFGRNLESHYIQAGSGIYGQFEWYLQGFYRNGTNSRPFGVFVNKQDGSNYFNFTGDTYSFLTSPANGSLTNMSWNMVTGTISYQGSSPSFGVTNTTAGGGVFNVLPQAAGSVNINNGSSTAFPGNKIFMGNNLIQIGGLTPAAEDSPHDLFQINATSTQTGFANMSINTITASRSAAIAWTQGTGDGSSGNRNIALGLDGNQSDNFYGLGGSSNNFLFRFYNGAAFQTALTVYTATGNVGVQSLTFQPTNVATAAGTTTLTASLNGLYVFTGATTQTVVLPVVTTLNKGFYYRIVNLSSGTVTVQTSGSNTIKAMAQNTSLDLWVFDTAGGTGTASWNWFYNATINN